MNNSKASIGVRIKVAREQRELTQEDLGLLVNLSRVSIANIESGKQTAPFQTMIRIAQKLNKPLTYFARVKGDNFPDLEFQLPLSVHREIDKIPLDQVRSFIAFRKRLDKQMKSKKPS